MDALSYTPRAYALESRSPRETCHFDKHLNKQVCRRESFFHRVGRYILIAILLFFAITALCILLCCLKMRKKKSANRDVAVGEAPPKKGIMGLFGKKNKGASAQQYNLETAQPNGMYGKA